MRVLISLVLAVCLMVGGVAVAAECDDVLYDCPVYANTYGDTYDLPAYSADYAVEPDVDWVPTILLMELIVNERFAPAYIIFQR